MDAAYDQAAAAYGFECRGCDDNCCRTRFHHHTLLEHLYLREGLSRLPQGPREEIRAAAEAVKALQAEAPAAGAGEKPFCPLNREGRCGLYGHRPMICRLHGIPHELCLPGRSPQLGPGCAEFHRRCGRSGYRTFDRTPLYAALARLESEFQQALGLSRKRKMTVAEMILEDEYLP
jgi:Fe-S-cluster containining protein